MQMIHILKKMVHIEGGNKVLIVLPSISGGRRQERKMGVLQEKWSLEQSGDVERSPGRMALRCQVLPPKSHGEE
jgi:hypothetical protein